MTNYLAALTAVAALGAAACSAAEPPAQAPPVAAPAANAAGVSHYVQAAAGSQLNFSFMQAGAENQGEFKQFVTELGYEKENLAASSLQVTVQTGSFDTQDKDRNDTLAGADLLDPKKFPTARFTANSFAKGAKGIEAVGKLTLHGVTRDLKLPLDIKTTATGAVISGETVIKRLDYGVGQGDWKTTEWVGDEVKLQYKVALTRAAK
ncbi:MAG: YceI family protein [Pseudomonadota bacterium]